MPITNIRTSRKTTATAIKIIIALGLALIYGCSSQSSKQAQTTPNQQQNVNQHTSIEQPAEIKKRSASTKKHDTQQKAKPLSTKKHIAAKKPDSTTTSIKSTETSDLWPRLRNGLQLGQHYNNPGIEKQVTWYKNSQSYIDRVISRGQPFLHYIIGELEANDMPLELALLPAVESAFDPLAYSHSHASGLWQFIPGTGKRFGLQRDWWYDGRRDPVASTEAAIKYLKYLNKFFDGDWLLALAAYNSGEGNVRRAIKRNKKAGKPTDFW